MKNGKLFLKWKKKLVRGERGKINNNSYGIDC